MICANVLWCNNVGGDSPHTYATILFCLFYFPLHFSEALPLLLTHPLISMRALKGHNTLIPAMLAVVMSNIVSVKEPRCFPHLVSVMW